MTGLAFPCEATTVDNAPCVITTVRPLAPFCLGRLAICRAITSPDQVARLLLKVGREHHQARATRCASIAEHLRLLTSTTTSVCLFILLQGT